MKQLNINLTLLLAIGLLLLSCEKTVTNVKLPKQERKLAVYSYISPEDSLIKVHVSLSFPIWEPNTGGYYETVKNATVKISGNGTEAVIPFDANADAYILSSAVFSIFPGNTYAISVSTSDGMSTEATCTVPLSINNSLQLVSIDTLTEEWGGKKIRFKVRFTDIAGEINFYRIGGVYKYIDLYAPTQDTIQEQLYPKYNMEYFTDNGNDGITFTGELVQWFYDDSDWMEITGLQLMLISSDQHYYHFHKSLENYTGDDPFSEPSLIYTNMQGGLGVFAAYRIHVKDVPL